MALGPKAMGEAIAHNLRAKTGRTLDEWLSALDAADPDDRAGALSWLKEQGLGHFQAQLVVDRRDGRDPYADPEATLDALFRAHPEQRDLYEQVVAAAQARHGLAAAPCRDYVPLYSQRRRIVVSLRPTDDGLYLGLVGETFPFPVVAHRKALGGSERMTRGLYVQDAETALAAVAVSYAHDEATPSTGPRRRSTPPASDSRGVGRQR